MVLKAEDVTAPAVKAGLAKMDKAVAEHRDLLPSNDDVLDVNPDKTVGTIEVEIAGNGTDKQSNQALEVLRTRRGCTRRSDRFPASRRSSAATPRWMPTSRTR